MQTKEEINTVFSNDLLAVFEVVRTGTLFPKRKRLTRYSTQELLYLQDIYFRFGEPQAITYLSQEYKMPRSMAELLFKQATGTKLTKTGQYLASKHLKMEYDNYKVYDKDELCDEVVTITKYTGPPVKMKISDTGPRRTF